MVKEIENIQEKLNWHWRNSMRPARFFSFDARAALPLPLLIIHPRISTIVLFIAFLIVFRYLERKGLTFPSAVRNFRAWFVGRDRPGWLGVFERRFRDFG